MKPSTAIVSRQQWAVAWCRRILYALVLIMVFEGILRKLLSPLSMLIFFGKDLLCLAGLVLLAWVPPLPMVRRLTSAWRWLLLLLVPVLLGTGFHDPVLMLFAVKQYLLYVVVGALVLVSFQVNDPEPFRRFLFGMALLLVPTAVVALLQNALPPGHWLNTDLSGESLEAFSAGGFLRVGSTFSFTAQYSWFLVAESMVLGASYFMPPNLGRWTGTAAQYLLYPALLVTLVVSAFVTGGRTAVLGSAGTLALGLGLLALKRPSWALPKGALLVGGASVGLGLLRGLAPQYFLAYDTRAADTEGMSHNQAMANRVLDGLTGWTTWFWEQDLPSVLFGNGLGVMSNGASQLSHYAAAVRNTGLWTETDMSTTFWEGGLYLGVVWYGFRLLCIGFCFRQWWSISHPVAASAAAAPLAYVIVQGLLAQLGMQPPLSIWWWLGIGIVLFIAYLERYRKFVAASANASKQAVAA